MNQEVHRTITLTLTHSCNLSCLYCYESGKSPQKMSFETAKEIIDDELNREDYSYVEIDLFGGEPFLEFELINRLYDYVSSKDWKQDYLFFAVTNGTLVHDKIQEWLRERRDSFICGLSYDGSPQMQDINRSNSADAVDLTFFQELYPDQPIKMTISEQSLKTLADGVEYLYRYGFKDVSCNLAYGIDWTNPQNERILSEELMKLIDFFIANPEYKPCSLLDMGIGTSVKEQPLYRFCGAGINMAAYDVDGTSYPCQMFMPMTSGAEKASKSHGLKFYENTIPEECIDEKCKDCIIKSSCPTCYGANYVAFGNIYKHADDYCKLVKTIMKARSFFKGLQWEKGQLNLNDNEKHTLFNNILRIQENL